MNVFLTLSFLFLIGSFCGWVLEVFFRRFVSAKRWINPGFLTGPYLPLYGFGVTSFYYLSRLDLSFIENIFLQKLVLVVIMGLVATLVEYIAGIIFIKGLKTKLWDYSDRWGNIQGIICPLFTLFWTIIALLYNLLLDPVMVKIASWYIANAFNLSFFIGMVFGIMLIDFCVSVNIVKKVKQFATEQQIVVKWERLKESIAIKAKANKERVSFALPFMSKHPFKENLENYLDHIKESFEKLSKKSKK